MRITAEQFIINMLSECGSELNYHGYHANQLVFSIGWRKLLRNCNGFAKYLLRKLKQVKEKKVALLNEFAKWNMKWL